MSDATEYPNYDKPCSICAQPMGLFAGFDGKHCNTCWNWANLYTGPAAVSISVGPFAPRAQVRYRLTRPNAKAPTYATAGASGMDGYVAAWRNEMGDAIDGCGMTLDPGERVLCHLGIACEIPPGLELQVRPRSGLALKQGVVEMFGTVDSDYRGEIGATLVNLGSEPATIGIGDRVCQLVLAPVVRAEMVLADELGETKRGAGGFGSTGK